MFKNLIHGLHVNHVIYPDYVATVTTLPVDELRSRGVKVLAFDLDHTLAPGRTRIVGPEYMACLVALAADGFRLIVASNAPVDLSRLGAALGAAVVPATIFVRKPFRSYYRRVIDAAGCPAGQIAMVGNRSVNDVLGANLAGLITIKVDSLR